MQSHSPNQLYREIEDQLETLPPEIAEKYDELKVQMSIAQERAAKEFAVWKKESAPKAVAPSSSPHFGFSDSKDPLGGTSSSMSLGFLSLSLGEKKRRRELTQKQIMMASDAPMAIAFKSKEQKALQDFKSLIDKYKKPGSAAASRGQGSKSADKKLRSFLEGWESAFIPTAASMTSNEVDAKADENESVTITLFKTGNEIMASNLQRELYHFEIDYFVAQFMLISKLSDKVEPKVTYDSDHASLELVGLTVAQKKTGNLIAAIDKALLRVSIIGEYDVRIVRKVKPEATYSASASAALSNTSENTTELPTVATTKCMGV